MKKRIDQLNSLLRGEVAALLSRHLNEQKFGLFTVTGVQTAKSFDSARVYVSCLKNSHQFEAVALRRIVSIQKDLNKKLAMKKVPKIIFQLDRTTSSQIYEL